MPPILQTLGYILDTGLLAGLAVYETSRNRHAAYVAGAVAIVKGLQGLFTTSPVSSPQKGAQSQETGIAIGGLKQ